MNVVNLWLGKMGTIISDRRAIAAILAVVFSLLGIPYTTNTIDNNTVSAVVAIIQGVIALSVSLGVIKSWEGRPPSGLKYKEVLQAFLEGDSEEMQALRQWLKDAGVQLED